MKALISAPTRRDSNHAQARRILLDIADITGFTVDEILSPSRARDLVDARHLAIYEVHTCTNLSSIEIGRLFGRDHSTVLHAITRIRRRGGTE